MRTQTERDEDDDDNTRQRDRDRQTVKQLREGKRNHDEVTGQRRKEENEIDDVKRLERLSGGRNEQDVE